MVQIGKMRSEDCLIHFHRLWTGLTLLVQTFTSETPNLCKYFNCITSVYLPLCPIIAIPILLRASVNTYVNQFQMLLSPSLFFLLYTPPYISSLLFTSGSHVFPTPSSCLLSSNPAHRQMWYMSVRACLCLRRTLSSSRPNRRLIPPRQGRRQAKRRTLCVRSAPI